MRIATTLNARAVEIHVIAGGGIGAPLKELAARFERASGHTVVIRFGTTPELIELATTGAAFDAGVVPGEVLADAAARERFATGHSTDIARVGLGVAVRAGTARPDIGTADALRQALLGARSIATLPASAAGAQVLKVFDELGIGESLRPRIRAQPNAARLVEAVRSGEAELGVFLLNVLAAPGLDVVGPLPADLQKHIAYTASVAASARQREAAGAFIAFLTTPTAAAVLEKHGMEPARVRR